MASAKSDAAAVQENATSAVGSTPTAVGEAAPQPPAAVDSFSWGHNERERYRMRYLESDPPTIFPWDVDTQVDEAEYAARYCPSPTWGAPSRENTGWGNTGWVTTLPQEASSGLEQEAEATEGVEMTEDGDERVEKKLDIYEDVQAMEDVHGCESLTPLQRNPWGARQS